MFCEVFTHRCSNPIARQKCKTGSDGDVFSADERLLWPPATSLKHNEVIRLLTVIMNWDFNTFSDAKAAKINQINMFMKK